MAWREAASLMVVSASSFKLLLLQRVATSSFMPNLYVFPGGQLDAADSSPLWLSQFPALTEFATAAAASRPSQLAPLLVEHAKRRDSLPGELSFRLCALRETFEESGLLLAARAPRQPVAMSDAADMSAKEWRRWQQRVKSDASAYLALHAELRLLPDVWSLHEWSNWLTPARSKRRFDTLFFLYVMHAEGEEAKRTAVKKDEAEVAEVEWLAPAEALIRHATGSLTLAPPQIYEMARFCEFSSASELKQFAVERERFGNVRFCPFVVKSADGEYALLPGDFRYPGDEVACRTADQKVYEESLEGDEGDLNRLCNPATKGYSRRVLCNVSLCHHVIPSVLSNPPRCKL